MPRIFQIIAVLLLVLVQVACSDNYRHEEIKFAALLPHHLLVEKQIDDVYQDLQINRKSTVRRIFIISPDHFNYGRSDVQMVREFGIFPLANRTIDKLGKEIAIDSRQSLREHGLTVHAVFAQRYFPKAELIPIRIKPMTELANVEKLIRSIKKEFNPETDLLIASIDFAHYVSDDFASDNDEKIIQLIDSSLTKGSNNIAWADLIGLAKSPDPETHLGVGIDSPQSLYVLLGITEHFSAQKINFYPRTSTKTITGISVDKDNTSHLFATFAKINDQ